MSVKCHTCGRKLRPGDSAYVADWHVLDLSGGARTELRYTCETCHGEMKP